MNRDDFPASVTSPPGPFADACPKCFPDAEHAVLPSSVTEEESGSLRAEYGHVTCGARWLCWWNRNAVEWPERRQEVTELRTCYCGATALVSRYFPHPDCDGSVPAEVNP